MRGEVFFQFGLLMKIIHLENVFEKCVSIEYLERVGKQSNF